MGKPVATQFALHRCDVPDAVGTHLEIPIFFPYSKKVKVVKMPVCLQGDQTFCLNRILTPAGPVPIPLPNVIQKGSAKVKFEKKPVARKDDPMAHGGKINSGIFNVKIGG